MKRILYIIILLTVAMGTKAQTLTERQELTGTMGTGEYAPMWHMANRQGLSSEKNCMVAARAGLGGRHHFTKSGIGLNWDVDLAGGMNLTSDVFIQQAYIDFTWKNIRLSVGQKERWGEMSNHRLTTGALIESGNARPIPQVRFDLPHYWNIPGCKGWFGIKGHIAYGRFTDGAWQENFVAEGKMRTDNVLYHSKAGFMRFGNEKVFPLTAEIGLHMVTQFGGTTYNKVYLPGYTDHSPSRFKDYLLALIPLKGDKLYDGIDQGNVAGNVLGSWTGKITWNSKDWMIRLCYDHVFEDHSQMFWEYGLWTEQLVGIELELRNFKWIKGVVLEYFNLKDQSGPIYHDSTSEIPDQISCQDKNYSHDKYGSWSNYGLIIGTPLVSSPIYNNDGTLRIYNNRVEAFHAGIEGSLSTWLDYRLLFTHSNNWGTYDFPFKWIKHDTSGLVEFTFKPTLPGNWQLTASFAFDRGDLYGNNYGGMLTIRRSGTYDIKNWFRKR